MISTYTLAMAAAVCLAGCSIAEASACKDDTCKKCAGGYSCAEWKGFTCWKSVKPKCPVTCGVCTPAKTKPIPNHCSDSTCATCAGGYACGDWAGYTCPAKVKAKCPKSCGACDAVAGEAAPPEEPSPAPASAPSPAAGYDAGCKTSWSCPSSWTTGGSAPHDAPDAKAFVAINNVYRCMHDVQAVQWDADVYASAKKWGDHTGTIMEHSDGDWCPYSDGENLAGTFAYSTAGTGVDATHMFYSEINAPGYCSWQKSCYQSFTAGHFTAMIWKTVDRIAFANPTGEMATARYRGCDGKPPNYGGMYKTHVPPPKLNFATCLNKVLACPAFSGVDASKLDICDISASCCKGSAHGGWYTKANRLYDLPEVLQPLVSNPWPLAVSVCAFVFFFAFAVKKVWRNYRELQLGTAASEGESLIEEDGFQE